jgi:hypothetical protein
MKRIVFSVLAAALCATSGVWAQTSDEPSEDYVLQQARDRYADQSETDTVEIQNSNTTTFNTPGGSVTIITTRNQKPPTDRNELPYTPFVLSFVPGISLPWGMYDTSFAFGYIGNLVGDVNGAQASGVFNIAAGEINGLQSAGVFNITGSVNGVQSAGIFNIADTVNGVQAAGLFNIAGQVTGAMIGLVNVADELDGVAIGLINIIGNGIHDLSVDYQYNTNTVYTTYRSGTPFLYASFYAGQAADELFSSSDTLTIGTGLGHRFRVLFLTADVELCAEMPVDTTSMAAVKDLSSSEAQHASWEEFTNALPPVFGSIRASFGFGQRRGFGAYLGVKTDFEVYGTSTVPERLRKSSGDDDSYRWQAFGTDFEFWPKIFIGLKF